MRMPSPRRPSLRAHLAPRIREMERVLGAKVLATTRGGSTRGGARLTPEARRLARVFAQWRGEVDRLSLVAFQKILRR